VVCFYGDRSPYFKAFGTKVDSEAYLFILDKKGVVRYQKEGRATASDLEEVKKITLALLAEI
jgi:predicted transcriptional regulator